MLCRFDRTDGFGAILLAAGSQSLLELIHSTACINKLLLAGKEGMALGADFNADITALGRASGNGLTACALDNDLFVVRMDSLLHVHILLSEFCRAVR
jgi:hypothetical protein